MKITSTVVTVRVLHIDTFEPRPSSPQPLGVHQVARRQRLALYMPRILHRHHAHHPRRMLRARRLRHGLGRRRQPRRAGRRTERASQEPMRHWRGLHSDVGVVSMMGRVAVGVQDGRRHAALCESTGRCLAPSVAKDEPGMEGCEQHGNDQRNRTAQDHEASLALVDVAREAACKCNGPVDGVDNEKQGRSFDG